MKLIRPEVSHVNCFGRLLLPNKSGILNKVLSKIIWQMYMYGFNKISQGLGKKFLSSEFLRSSRVQTKKQSNLCPGGGGGVLAV